MSSETDPNERSIAADWMGSLYSMGGHRWDWKLSLFSDGKYARAVTNTRLPEQATVESGTWSLVENESTLSLVPVDGKSSRWGIHFVNRLEEARTLLVLREVKLASRNLPIMLYRVYPSPEPHAPLGAYGFPPDFPT